MSVRDGLNEDKVTWMGLGSVGTCEDRQITEGTCAKE